MFHKAVDLKFKEGTILEMTFQDGLVKQYDMAVLFDKYPQLISQTVSQFSELRNLQPAGYETKPNEEFTEEEFFEDEGKGEEQEPETEAAKKEK